MKSKLVSLALIAIAALFASCTPSTPQGRAEEEPARYGKLSAKDKAMVDQGKIRTGMTQDAVYLAWGKPESVSKGGDGSGSTERWTYVGQTPVWSNQFNVGYGGGFGRGGYGAYYGGYDCGPYPYYDYGPTMTYVPYKAGVVHFRNGRVSKWEGSGD